MNVPHNLVKIDINEIKPSLVEYIQNEADNGVRVLDVIFLAQGRVIAMENGYAATAAISVNDVLITDNLSCTVDAANNLVKAEIDCKRIQLTGSGVMKVQITVTDGTNILISPQPVLIRLTSDLAQTAQILPNSHSSYSEIVAEIVAARGDYDNLAQALSHLMGFLSSETDDNVTVSNATETGKVYYTTVGSSKALIVPCSGESSQAQFRLDRDGKLYSRRREKQNGAFSAWGVWTDLSAAIDPAVVRQTVEAYIAEHGIDLGYVTPQQFGAKADGVTDDTDAIIQAIQSSGTVYFPGGTYKVHGSPINSSTEGIIIPSNCTIIMDDNAVIQKSETKLLENIFITEANARNITIKGGTIRGDRLFKMQNLTAVEYDTYSHNSSGIRVRAGKNIRIENVHIDSIAGDGIMLLSEGNDRCENIYIYNCVVEKSQRSNMWIEGARHVYINNCHFNYGGYRFDENGDPVIRNYADFINGASQEVINRVSGREIFKIVEIDGTDYAQIHGANPRAGINFENNQGEKIYITNSQFEGNEDDDHKGNDMVINNGYDEIYISNCVCSSRIASVRSTATDKIIFSGSRIKNILLHGEVLSNCIVTGEAWITRGGTRVDNCKINALLTEGAMTGEITLTHCMINSVQIAAAAGDVSTAIFQNCSFFFSHGYDSRFHGYKTVMSNCVVRFNPNYENIVTPFYNLRTFIAKNTTFEMLTDEIEQSVEGFFKNVNMQEGLIELVGCIFDITPYVSRILHQQTRSAVAINNTIINHSSREGLTAYTRIGSFTDNPGNYTIRNNVSREEQTKISDFNNDSQYVDAATMNQAIQTAIGGIENGSY